MFTIPLAWALLWLSIVSPDQYAAALQYPIVDADLYATRAHYRDNRIAEADLRNNVIRIDMRAIHRLEYGPWDTVVIAACSVAHEWAHLHYRTVNHYQPYIAETQCFKAFGLDTPTIRRWHDYRERWLERYTV